MRNKIIFILSGLGIALAIYGAYIYSRKVPAQPPVFSPAADPYANGIYANGIVESFQARGENINIYPEVTGPITTMLVGDGDTVKKGAVLLKVDDSVQRATTAQLKAQADAALAMLSELKAEPRKETLDIATAQVDYGTASLKMTQDEYAKELAAFTADPESVSRESVDNAKNAVQVAQTNLIVVQRQLDLTKAGAWIFDIQNQQKLADSLQKAYEASNALLAKYTICAPADGVVLSVESTEGSYVSSQGAYDSYTQAYLPLIVMGAAQDTLEVRCFVDEILVHRLPVASTMTAKMFIQGTDISIPLTFQRLQPYVSPKIELSDQRTEQVDVRVLPVIFRFNKPTGLMLFPGQLVDVYIGTVNEKPLNVSVVQH